MTIQHKYGQAKLTATPKRVVAVGLEAQDALPKDLDKLIGDQFGANISKERIDLLDTDALIWLVGDPVIDKERLQGDKLYGGLNVVKHGRDIYIPASSDYGNATSFVSVLSLPYLLDGLVPQLTAAADGNPATKVPADS